ncbi:dual specificity protein phosphatase family protein [Acinetobacter sp. WZC-1]|uniref:dual specificity protein phosphatase family protein n=1 Tax=Acinetobacter sp. WZC-1 TaxID=3459034 RepID=UPI00403DE092
MKKSIYVLLLIGCCSVQLTGCITTPALPDLQRPQQWGQPISRSHNFYKISETVYRSEQPDTALIPQLNQYGIQTIINLRSRDQDRLLLLDQQQFQLVHIPIHTWAMNRNDLLQVMQAIQTARQHQQKVLIHCYHGSDRTGAGIAMYRIIFEHWSVDDALAEMKQGGYGFHPVWINIEKLFRPENIRWIRQHLANPS